MKIFVLHKAKQADDPMQMTMDFGHAVPVVPPAPKPKPSQMAAQRIVSRRQSTANHPSIFSQPSTPAPPSPAPSTPLPKVTGQGSLNFNAEGHPHASVEGYNPETGKKIRPGEFGTKPKTGQVQEPEESPAPEESQPTPQPAATLPVESTPAEKEKPVGQQGDKKHEQGGAKEVYSHKWEEAGLGRPPYHLVDVFSSPSKSLAESNPEAYNREVRATAHVAHAHGVNHGSCDYCGTPIVHHFVVENTDGKRFVIGSDCVRQLGNHALTTEVEKAEKQRLKEVQRQKKELEWKKREEKRKAAEQEQRDRNGGKTDFELRQEAEKKERESRRDETAKKNAWLISHLESLPQGDFIDSMIDQLHEREAHELSPRQRAVLADIYSRGLRGKKKDERLEEFWRHIDPEEEIEKSFQHNSFPVHPRSLVITHARSRKPRTTKVPYLHMGTHTTTKKRGIPIAARMGKRSIAASPRISPGKV